MNYKQTVLNDSPAWFARCDDTAASTVLTATVGSNGTLVANASTMTTAGPLSADTSTALAVGSSGLGSASIDLTAYTHVALEFWLSWAAFAADDKLAFEFGSGSFAGSATKVGFLVDPDNSATNSSAFMAGMGGNGHSWLDGFTPRPSANTWHHYVCDFNNVDTGTPINTIYQDAVLMPIGQTATRPGSGLTGTTNFDNATLRIGSRGGSSLFAPSGTKYKDIAIYGGGLTAAQVAKHYNAGTSKVKTVAGLSINSVKTTSGLTIPSVKTIAGLA